MLVVQIFTEWPQCPFEKQCVCTKCHTDSLKRKMPLHPLFCILHLHLIFSIYIGLYLIILNDDNFSTIEFAGARSKKVNTRYFATTKCFDSDQNLMRISICLLFRIVIVSSNIILTAFIPLVTF